MLCFHNARSRRMHISSAAISCILRPSHDMSERPERKGQVLHWSPTGGHQSWNPKPAHSAMVLHRREASESESKFLSKRFTLWKTSDNSCTTASWQCVYHPRPPCGLAKSHSRNWSNSLTEKLSWSGSVWDWGLREATGFYFHNWKRGAHWWWLEM